MQAAKRAVAGEMACAPDEMVLVDNLTVAATIVAEGMLQECLLAREAEEAVILLNSCMISTVQFELEDSPAPTTPAVTPLSSAPCAWLCSCSI